MLQFDHSRPTDAVDGSTVAIMLHGRGSHRGDLQALRPAVPEDWGLVTPQAPHPGHPWSYGPGWAWYQYLEDDLVVSATLEQSLAALDGFFSELPSLLGYEPGRIVIGGFSQGGTVAMAYSLSRPGAVSSVFNFSGFLASSVDVPLSVLSPNAAPVFWGHGTRDDQIPISLAIRGRERLRKAGIEVVAQDYEIGHWIVPDEMAAALKMADGLE